MVIRYQPTIFIDDVAVASGAHADLKPVADISLEWGRDDFYSDPEATLARVSIIDDDGQWATDTASIGLDMRIVIPGGRTLFRGRISHVVVRSRVLWDPVKKANYRTYVASITAADRLADLRNAYANGPGARWQDVAGPGVPYSPTAAAFAGFENTAYGSNHWPKTDSDRRLADLRAAAAGIVDGIEDPSFDWVYQARYMAGEKSLHWLISALYARAILNRVGYDPDTNTVIRARSAVSTGLSLTYTGSNLHLDVLDGYAIPADALAIDDDAPLESTVQQAVGQITVKGGSRGGVGYLIDGQPSNPEGDPLRDVAVTVTVPGHASKPRTIEITTSLTTEDWMTTLGNWVAERAASINNQFIHPPVTFDFRRTQLNSIVEGLLLLTRTINSPVYFVGSKYNGLKNLGPQYQIIGGELQWEPEREGSNLSAGWVHTFRVARAVGVIGSLTVNQLVTNPTPTMSDYSDEITIADLGNVTQGAS